MKRQKWNSRYFKKIFVTMSIATFSVLIAALIALQLEFGRATTQYLNAINTKFVKNAAESITYRIETTQRDVLTAYSTHYGTVLMAATEPSAVNMMSALMEIDSKLAPNANLFSVYFYNSVTQKISVFCSNRSYLSFDKFELIINDPEILPILQKGEKVAPFSRKLSLPDLSGDQVDVFTQIFWTPATGGTKNAVVINTLPDVLFEVLNSRDTSYGEQQNNFLVFSSSHEILYNGITHQNLLDVGEDELTSLVRQNLGKDFFHHRIDGRVYYFNVFKGESNRIFVNIVDRADLAKSFSYNPIVYTAILCGACILAMALIVLFSRKLYLPIAALTDKLRQSTGNTVSETATSEIDFIMKSFDVATVKLDNLFEYKARTLSLSQIAFLQDQLLRNRYSPAEFWAGCKSKELPYKQGDEFVIIVAGFCENPARQETHMLNYALANVFYELVEDKCNVQQIPFTDNEFVFLCCFNEDQDTDLTEIMTTTKKIFNQYFRVSLSFFLSNPFSDVCLMAQKAQLLQRNSVYRFFYEDGCVINAETYDISTRKNALCHISDFEQFESAVRNGEYDEAMQINDNFFEQILGCTYETAQASINLFSAKFISMLHRIEVQRLATFALEFNNIYTSLTTARRLVDAQDIMQQTILNVCEQVNLEYDGTMHALAGKITEYIEKSYQDFNLSSKAIATQHHISVPTLNRIFKKKTGDSVANYIKKLRLTKSVELLSKTNLPVEVIASDVGFENTKYYYTLFKSEYGISPAQYRITNSVQ